MIMTKNIWKIKFNSDDELPLNKTIETSSMFFMKIINIIQMFFQMYMIYIIYIYIYVPIYIYIYIFTHIHIHAYIYI